MVVLRWHYHRQLCSWSCRRDQREYHSSGLGVHCRASTRNFHFAFREYTPRHSFRISLTNIMFQSVILFARFGNGIATNNLSKMLAGLMLPGRPVGNMYFAAWSHNIVMSSVSVSTDLKLGEYLKIPPGPCFGPKCMASYLVDSSTMLFCLPLSRPTGIFSLRATETPPGVVPRCRLSIQRRPPGPWLPTCTSSVPSTR